jgi:two-component system, OmpR family, sensor kinase
LSLTHLMENLLNSARLVDSGAELYFHPVEFDLAVLLREVCQLHREISPKSQILQRVKTHPLMMFGDPKLLFQAFSNILANAIKYSPGGGLIKFDAALDGDTVVVSIEDNGIGVPQEDLEHVFERYFRARNVTSLVGTGIGLYLVKMVVALHRGEVSVKSREGKGSAFTVRLPVKAPQQSPAEQDQADADPVVKRIAS